MAGAFHTKKTFSALTPSEIAALELAASGLGYAEIAERLDVARKTIERRFEIVREKLCAASTEEAVAVWRERAVA